MDERQVRATWTVLFALTAALACSRKAEQDVTTYAVALTARTSTMTFSFPAGVNQSQLAVAANGSLLIRDRANIGGPISNIGTVATSSGNDARLRDVWSQTTVVLGDRTTVTGTVRSAGSIQRSPSVVITGQALANINIGPFVTRTINVTFPDAADVDAILQPDQTKSIDPGRYRTVQVNARARLKLRTGTYYAETLQIEPTGILDVDDSSGPVVLYLAQPFTFRGIVITGPSGTPDVFFGVVGSGVVTIEAPFIGTVLAPSAKIMLGTGGASHTGAFFARDVELQPDVRIVQRASAALPTCDDGNACTARDVLTAGVCVGQDPVLTGVPESAPGALACPDGSAPIGCRGYDCSTSLPTAVWLAAPTCGPTYPVCTASCPAAGCKASRPRTADLVACDCSCADATGGAAFTITLDGCVQTADTCDALCRSHGTDSCGGASSCAFGSCQKLGTGTPRLIGHGICSLGEPLGIPQLADYRGAVDAAISRLTITVGPTATTVPISGTAGFHFDLPPSEGSGQAVMGSMVLTGSTFDFFGRHITGSRLELTQGAIASLSSIGSGRYSFSIGVAKLGMRTTANDNGVARTFDTALPATLNGTLDLPARRIDLTAAGSVPSGDRINFQATVRLANLPPVAIIAGPSPLTLECSQTLGAPLTLDGSGSSDPEGQVLRFQWFRRDLLATHAPPVPIARVSVPSVTAPFGQNAFRLVVSDPGLASARAERVVNVVDTAAPTVTVGGPQTFNAGAGAIAMTVALARPTIADVCDPHPRLETFQVKIEPDTGTILVPIDPNQVTLPVGNSNILWRVRDRSGNVRDAQQGVTITAVGSPGPGGTPVQAPACAAPLFPPGQPQVSVEVRVCVVGRINQGVREGSSVWSTCNDDACTENKIRDLISQANQPFSPDVTWTLPPNTSPAWKRIRDPFPNGASDCADNAPSYGSTCLRADPFNAGMEGNALLQDCWAAWGLPPPGSPTADTCTRGIILVLAGRPPANLCGLGQTMRSATSTSCADLSTVGANNLGSWAIALDVAGGCVPGNLASLVGHELGHSVGLSHGDGVDNDCGDNLWDGCDGDEVNDGPVSMMQGEDSGVLPLLLTNLQRDRARAFARQSVPTIGQSGQNCTAPPLPIAPGDTMGGQVTGSCSCLVAGPSATAFSLAGFVAIGGTMLLKRRRRGRAP